MRKLLSLLTVSFILFSCGGGGGDSSEESAVQPSVEQTSTSVSETTTTPNTYTLTGHAVDDYVLNGTVKVYDILTGKLLATAVTSEKGEFRVEVPTSAEVLVKVEGGVLDPDGDPQTKEGQKPFNKNLVTIADLSVVQGGKKLLVTPSSTAVAASALGVDSGALMKGEVDPAEVLAHLENKVKIVESFKDGIEKLPEDLKPVVKEDAELHYKEKLIAKLVEKAGGAEKVAKELEDLQLDGDAGITQDVLEEIKEEVTAASEGEAQHPVQPTSNQTAGSSYAPYYFPSGSGGGVSGGSASVQTSSKTVTVRVVDDNGNPISAASVTARVLRPTRAGENDEVSTASLQSDQGGYANLELKVPKDGGVIEITVTKNGMAETVKSVKFDSDAGVPDRITVKAVRAEYSRVADTSSSETLQLTRSGEKKKLVFYIVKNKRTNTRSLRVGKPALRRDGSEEVTFKMEVPSDLYEGVSKVRVDITNFDPSNKTDAEKMPSWVDSNGNQLASVAFDYVKLTNLDTGEPLKRSVRAEGDPVVVVRYVKCSLLKGDSKPEEPGYQVPFYILKDGVWNYLGEGVVVTDYEGNTPKKVENVCSNTNYEYVKITIENPDFSDPYINLDYPLITDVSNIVEKCANLRFVSSKNGTPVTNLWVGLWDDDNSEDFYWSEGTTDREGRVRIKTTYYNSDNTNDTTARIGYWNDFTSQWVETTVNLDSCDSEDFTNVTVTVPSNLCFVQGKVSGENGEGEKVNISVYARDWSYYKWTESDESGLYSVQVPCNVDSYLVVKDEQVEFSVDGNKTGEEFSDTGSTVTINLTVRNAAPYPWAWTDAPQFVNPTSIPVNVGVYDEEGDFPITVTVKLLDNNGNEVASARQEINSSSFDSFYGQGTVNLDVGSLDNGIYNINVIATDSKGHVRSLRDMLSEWGGMLPQVQIVSASGSNPPVLEYTYAFSQGKRVYADVSASDVDGDLNACGIHLFAENGTEITPDPNASYNETQGDYCWGHYEFIAGTAGNYTVEFTASDSSESVSTNQTVYVQGDLPLQVFMWVDKAYNLRAGDVVFVNVHLEDDDPVNATGLRFTVNGEEVTEECSFDKGKEPVGLPDSGQTTCYYVDEYTYRDLYLQFVVPDDNETSYEVCVNGTLNGESVNKCSTLYKGSVPTNAELQINIRE